MAQRLSLGSVNRIASRGANRICSRRQPLRCHDKAAARTFGRDISVQRLDNNLPNCGLLSFALDEKGSGFRRVIACPPNADIDVAVVRTGSNFYVASQAKKELTCEALKLPPMYSVNRRKLLSKVFNESLIEECPKAWREPSIFKK